MNTIKKMLWKMLGRVILDEAVLRAKGPTILHISDTPTSFYPELNRLLGILKPNCIVHTGDLADDLKLQLRPSLLRNYESALVKLMQIVNQSAAEKVIFTLGNHDNLELVRRYAGRAEFYEDAITENFQGIRISCAHYHEAALGSSKSKRSDFYLYGHDLSLKSQRTNEVYFLNGIEAMHLIDLSTGEVFEIMYPGGTDSARLNRKRMRL
ncbi:metallophosphoesterase [Acidaminobacter sp.]|uniref:metallophosphoesterase n=1 Tax=Acidaminobacter sp. TaxID=1872102 RepID=UPI00256B5415|nr:metallophosphoesterase [Acidaminobacter sp.]MDK9712116.1 metallophosphatase family protein [Acidaminobacter sp.]